MLIKKVTGRTGNELRKEFIPINEKCYGKRKAAKIRESVLRKPKDIYFGAYDGKKLTGNLRGQFRNGVAHIGMLMIAEKHRGKGIGKELVLSFEKEAKEQGCHKITVNTTAEIDNSGFYRKMGYKKEAKFENDSNNLTLYRYMKFI